MKGYVKLLIRLYDDAKVAKIGDLITCPSCKTEFRKTHWQQKFCKTKPKTECKDYYWNNVDEKKRNNTTRISPASKAWLKKQYQKEMPMVWVSEYTKMIDGLYDNGDDFGWDSHKDSF